MRTSTIIGGIFCLALICGSIMYLALLSARIPNDSYEQGYIDGSRRVAAAFLSSNAYLAPLTITNDNITVTNCLFITVPSVAISVRDNINNMTISGCRIYSGY